MKCSYNHAYSYVFYLGGFAVHREAILGWTTGACHGNGCNALSYMLYSNDSGDPCVCERVFSHSSLQSECWNG
jgi:hypothetical protein